MDEGRLLELLFDIHDELPRQGPGSTESTVRALRSVPRPRERRTVLDIGCGTGPQTLVLVRELPEARIVAVDVFRGYLDELDRRGQASGLDERIETRLGEMEKLDIATESQDLVWAEGSVFIMGFGAGLRAWKPLLAPGGALALSEACWLTDDRPAECVEFWAQNYPAMSTVDDLLATCAGEGYRVLDSFTLPERDWLEEFYLPLEGRLVKMREKYRGDPEALEVVEASQTELDFYKKYSKVWGYLFLVLEPLERA